MLVCLKDPARYFGKPAGDAIDIINVAINAQQAKNDGNRVNLDGIEFNEDGGINEKSLLAFVQGMPKNELGALMDDDGEVLDDWLAWSTMTQLKYINAEIPILGQGLNAAVQGDETA